MALSDHYNATYTITRQVRSGSEDGTPVYTTTVVAVSGWFDEIEVRAYDESSRGETSIAYADRRASFYCDVDADIQQDDTGTMTVDAGINRGKWDVSMVRTAPIPGGAGHLECQMQGAKESI